MSDPWEGILDPDERILWQGAPDSSFHVPRSNLFEIAFGLVFVLAAVGFGVEMLRNGHFQPLILIHFFAGLAVMVHGLLWPSFKLRRTFYSLSDKRAFIATAFPFQGRRLQSYPIGQNTNLNLDDAALGSVWFASRQKRTKNGSRAIPIGFERIPAARDVFTQMRTIQRERDLDEHRSF